MKIRCIAIDDEPLALQLLSTYAARCPELQLLHTFDDALSAAEYLRRTPVDLLFLDIHMPDITGMDLVRSLTEKPLLIFTTAYKHFACEGFDLDAVDYLLKPISYERFCKAIHKADSHYRYRHNKQHEPEYLYVYSEYKRVRIDLQDIIYIESREDYIRIHLVNDRSLLTLMPLKRILEMLPPARFRRIHRSYIVSLDRVAVIGGRKIQLTCGTSLPVSENYASGLREWLPR